MRTKLVKNIGSCNEVGCDRPPRCRGVCARHYRRLHYQEHERARRGARERPNTEVGSKSVNSGGYVVIKTFDGWVLEHREVVAERIGRPLLSYETVHHINGDKTDNRSSNLELWSSIHPKGQRVADLVEFAEQILKEYSHVR